MTFSHREYGAVAPGILVGSLSRKAGGLFNSVRRSAQELSSFGARVSVFGVRDEFTDKDLQAWSPLKPSVRASRGPSFLRYAPGLFQDTVSADLDLIHLHGIWQHPSRVALKWKQLTGKPVIISPRGMLDPWAVKNARWKKSLAGFAFEYSNLHSSSCIHALNQSEAESVREFGLKNPIAIIPNGTDIPVFSGERETHKPDWMRDDPRRVLLFVGRIHPKKGIEQTIRAFAQCVAEAPSIGNEWRLVIAGWDDGGHLDDLKRIVKELGLERDVVFPGGLYGEYKAAALSHASAFVLASFSEGLPMSVLEAWAYSLPVLKTVQCNLPVGFSAGAALEISNDEKQLAAQLVQHLSRRDLHSIGLAGRTLAEAEFGWRSIARQHLQLYHWVRFGGDVPSFVMLD